MKTIHVSLAIAAMLLVTGLSSCKKKEATCSGSGTLKLTNSSHATVQRAMIDGVNYGSLDPGEAKEISLPAGQHDWQLVGISGGSGCSAAKVTIVECKTAGFECGG
jgi:hypothetical protein